MNQRATPKTAADRRHMRGKTKPPLNPRRVTHHDEQAPDFLAGAATLARVVGATLGPGGRNVTMEQGHTWTPRSTKDGVTVAGDVVLCDPLQNVAAQIIRQAAEQTVKDAGDGTTTATLLAEAIYRNGERLISARADTTDIIEGIRWAEEQVQQLLGLLAEPVLGLEEIRHTATLACNGDAALGNLITEAVAQVGSNGSIEAAIGQRAEDELVVEKGLHLDHGATEDWLTHATDGELVLEQPLILLVEGAISDGEQILPLLETVYAHHRDRTLLVVAGGLQNRALELVKINTQNGTLRVVYVRAPGVGDTRRAALEDLAAVTGATPILSEGRLNVGAFPAGALGTAEVVVVTERRTSIRQSSATPQLNTRIAQLQHQLAGQADPFHQQQIRTRLARLTGGIAVIKVGAATELEARERKDRLDDALAATRAAIEEGTVPGAGSSLLRLAAALRQLLPAHAEQRRLDWRLGALALADALEEPARRLVANTGTEAAPVLIRTLAESAPWGWDARRQEYGDLRDLGVVDPAKVVRSALRNATSAATMLLSCACAVTLARRPSA